MKRPAEKYPQKVEQHDQQQQIGAPVMDVADQLAEINRILQMHDGVVSPVGNGLVDEFEHQARGKKHSDQHQRHAAEPPGKREP